MRWGGLAAVLWAAVASGCTPEGGSTAPQAPLQVGVVAATQADVPLYSEWIGTTDGLVTAKIRAQVSGYLIRRHYGEGAFVKRGTLLFEIDPRPFQAAYLKAKAELGKAQAQLVKTELDVKRDTPLARVKAISEKELDDSIQAYEAAKASVDSARATLEQARLNLEWTRITAPIDGVVGIAKAQIGDLVGPTGEELTAMSTLDPIKVYFPISEQEYLRAADRVQEAYRNPGTVHEDRLEMVLSDGSTYPHRGRFLLVDRQVDVKTGTIRVAAVFPNPGNVLRPGQFARVRALTDTRRGAVLVPQRAVTELQGGHQVAVVGPGNEVEIRPVTVGARTGGNWIVEQGVAAGDRVIVEGLQKVRAGMVVDPRPYVSAPAEEKAKPKPKT